MKLFLKRLRKPTAIGCSLMFVIIAARNIWGAVAYDRDIPTTVIIVTLAIGLAFGLFRQFRWALRSSAAIFLLIAVFLPVGVLNPFTAGDYMGAGIDPPSVARTLVWLVPLEALLLATVYVLDQKE